MLIRDPLVDTYSVRIRAIFTGLILTTTLVAFVFPRFATVQGDHQLTFVEQVESFDIPPTRQLIAPPPPSRPAIPIEADEEDFAQDITIDETGLDDFTWDAPPPAPEQGPSVAFIAYEVAPEPIGGYPALLRNLVYPEMALSAGLEGTILVRIFVDITGKVTETIIVQGIPETGLDEAAVTALKMTPFTPALQRDQPVGVWIAVPIIFQLSG